jgi:hypothetical protein
VIAAVLALAGLVLFVVRRWRRRRGAARAAPPPPASAHREWRCQCGQDYLVAGGDRHRIYWLADAEAGDPVLGEQCVRCGAHLPAEREQRAPATPGMAPVSVSEQGQSPSA